MYLAGTLDLVLKIWEDIPRKIPILKNSKATECKAEYEIFFKGSRFIIYNTVYDFYLYLTPYKISLLLAETWSIFQTSSQTKQLFCSSNWDMSFDHPGGLTVLYEYSGSQFITLDMQYL
jgi:hypothetical protein